jgi:hypothetical protein
MAEVSNVFTDLGDGRKTYKEFQDIGILTGPRMRPRMLDKGMNGFYLGLYDPDWVQTSCSPSGAETYFVRVVPQYSKFTDPNAAFLKGVPNTENTTKGVTFYFDPFPDGYACDGYEVWAGTVSGTLYLQGTLSGRFTNTFVIGTTWSYNSTGSTLDPLTIGPPAFASLVSVYQGEGEINSRVILAGGKKYTDGYAKVAQVAAAPVLTCGEAGSSTPATWAAVSDGSFKMRINRFFYQLTGIDFTGAASMAAVATILQTKLQGALPPVLYGGGSVDTTLATWQAITDGSLRIFVDGVEYDFTGLDFSGDASMADIAATIQTKMQLQLGQATVTWDAVNESFIINPFSFVGQDQVVNGGFDTDTDWTKDSGWTIGSGTANLSQTPLDAVTNGTFDTDSDWTKGSSTPGSWSISSAKARWDKTGASSGGNNISQALTSLANGIRKRIKWDITMPTTTNEWASSDGKNGNVTHNNLSSQTYNINYVYTALVNDISISCSTNTTGDIGKQAQLDDVQVLYLPLMEMYQEKASGTWNGTTMNVGYTISSMSGSGRFRVEVRDDSGNVADVGTVRTANGTYEDTLTIPSDNDYNRLYLIDESRNGTADAVSYSIDNVSMLIDIDSDTYCSFLSRHSSDTGTDVSEMMLCRGESAGVFLTPKAKDTSSHTVTWSTDHFVIADVNTGSEYRLSFLETVSADVGTDISGASWMAGTEATGAVYTPGQTAKRSVIGDGTNWGEWGDGMEFRGKGEDDGFLIKEVRSATEIVLDEDYAGDLFNGFKEYLLEPFDAQIYESDLGNPFAFRTTNIQRIPVEKSEGITTLKTSGFHTAIMLQESTWIIDSVDITSPIRVSPDDGCPNNEAAIEYDNGVVFFTGDDFKALRGRDIVSIDPEDRMRGIIGRISSNAPYPMGTFLPNVKANILVWAFGLDDSYVYNVGVCYNPKTGAWWLWNLKDVNCLTTLKDSAGKFFMATGSTYDDSHSVPSFVKLYSRDYFNDGASQSSSNTKQGTIATGGIGAPSTIAGYLTCAAAFSSTFGDWTGITDGYFAITIDDAELLVGPCDFSGDGSMAAIATTIQTAIRAATGAGGSEVVAWDTDHFVITSGTTTNRSNVSYMRPYYPSVGITELSSVSYMNGREGSATKTGAVNTITLTLNNWDDDASAVLSTTNDGEKGVYLAFSETDGQSLQYGLITANSAGTVTITPVPSTLPEAGWRWYLGGINPTWYKWFDFGSPQHLQRVVALAFTTNPDQAAARNFLHLLYYHDLTTTVRKSITQQLGTTIDTVNTLELRDREATQHGFKIIRPNSERDLVIEDITITHHPLV